MYFRKGFKWVIINIIIIINESKNVCLCGWDLKEGKKV